MNENHRELLSIAVTITIVILAGFIIHNFIPSLVWAAVIAIATYPLYKRWEKGFGTWKNTSALIFTCLFSILLFAPLSWVITIVVKELQLFVNYLQLINKEGGEVPTLLSHLPFFGSDLTTYWDANLGHPGNLKNWLSDFHLKLTPVSYYAKEIGFSIAHRSVQLGFTILILFFFYRDGNRLFKQIDQVGEYCLGDRWFRYADRLPSALRATVNGTIFVGLGVGVVMGCCYAIVGFPAPTLTGFITAFAAMIPFVVPVVFITVALILMAAGSLFSAIFVLIWGTVVMFVADHFIKPVLIGGATQLPFLVVLFGILGGLETIGILGLFVGPIIMVLFITLWKELQQLQVEKQRLRIK